MPIQFIKDFVKLETSAGIMLMFAAALALIASNTGLQPYYEAFLNIPVSITAGSFSLAKPLLLWVNDGLMAIFFLVIGLEIKLQFHEGRFGEGQWLLPSAAALGGMLVPAALFIAFNYSDSLALEGWAIPAATDIAFTLGILSMFGSRVPIGVKVFLMTFAILDDLAAIIIIALFYTDQLSMLSLLLALGSTLLLIYLNIKKVKYTSIYVVVGVFLWVCVLKSGVHATLAGVIVAFTLPSSVKDKHAFDGSVNKPDHHLVHDLIQHFHPWVAFLIVPLFAFMNSGINLIHAPATYFVHPIAIGIMVGLFVGKQIGIFGFTWLVIKAKMASLPEDVTWGQLYGAAVLGGIGFTMSLFIATLAYEDLQHQYMVLARLGIMMGSLASILFGALWLNYVLPKRVKGGVADVA